MEILEAVKVSSKQRPRKPPPGLPRKSSFPYENRHLSFPNSSSSTLAPPGFFTEVANRTSISASAEIHHLDRLSLTATDSVLDETESKTSSSIFQSLIIVVIIMSCLVASICTMVQDLCDESLKWTLKDCSQVLSYTFPLINITVCVTEFGLFFLHMIGYCNSITWNNKSKLLWETLLNTILLGFLTAVCVLSALFTFAFVEETSMVGLSASGIACLGLMIRCCYLLKEIVLLFSKTKSLSPPDTPLTIISTSSSKKKRSRVKRSFSTFRSKFRRFSVTEEIDFEASIPVVKIEDNNKIVFHKVSQRRKQLPGIVSDSIII